MSSRVRRFVAVLAITLPVVSWGSTARAQSAEGPGDPDRGDGQRALGYVVITVGATAMPVGATFAALKLVNLRKVDDLCDNDSPVPCTNPEANEARDAADRYEALSNAFMFGGIAVLAAGVAIAVTAPSDDEGEEPGEKVGIAPWIGPGGGGAAITTHW